MFFCFVFYSLDVPPGLGLGLGKGRSGKKEGIRPGLAQTTYKQQYKPSTTLGTTPHPSGTFMRYESPEVTEPETFLKSERPEVPGPETFLKKRRP